MTHDERLCEIWRRFTRQHDQHRAENEHRRASICVDRTADWFEGYAMAMRDAGYFDAASDALFLSSLAMTRDSLFFEEYLEANHG